MYLGFDLGTTNVKAVVTDGDSRVVATGSAPVERFYTPDGGIEQDIEQIWAAACTAIRQALGGVIPRRSGRGRLQPGRSCNCSTPRNGPWGGSSVGWTSRGQPFDRAFTAELGEDFLAEHVGHAGSTMTIGQILRLQSSRRNCSRPSAMSALSATRSWGGCAAGGPTTQRPWRSPCSTIPGCDARTRKSWPA